MIPVSHFHPLSVHFPIALITVAFLADCKYRVKIAQLHRVKTEQLEDVKLHLYL